MPPTCWDVPLTARHPHEMDPREELAFWHWTTGRIYGYQRKGGALYYHKDKGHLWITVASLLSLMPEPAATVTPNDEAPALNTRPKTTGAP